MKKFCMLGCIPKLIILWNLREGKNIQVNTQNVDNQQEKEKVDLDEYSI